MFEKEMIQFQNVYDLEGFKQQGYLSEYYVKTKAKIQINYHGQYYIDETFESKQIQSSSNATLLRIVVSVI